jgi:magnesium-transporting ATPase (P-type)
VNDPHSEDEMKAHINKDIGLFSSDSKNYNERDDLQMYQFWLMCAICNDILVIKKNGKIDYHGSSTDEITLVNAADKYGFKLIERTPHLSQIVI